MTDRKKLIEVALPLEAINEASAREKSIRHGHPSTLHLWWARRPLAACRAVIFTSLVDDPNNPNAPEAFVEACKKLPKGKNAIENDTPRQRLFDFIERLVTWEATTDEEILEKARELIRLSTDGNPPPLLDPFAGGGSIPLEAQRLGLEAHASDLNPVAVMINKAMIEIPPLFKDRPPVNPRDREKIGAEANWKGAAGLAADVRYYGEWMEEKAWERIGHLYPKCNGETVIAWLWARTVQCPNPVCRATIPLVSTFWLCKKKGKKVWLEPVINQASKKIKFKVKKGVGSPKDSPKVGRGAKFRCLVCGEVAPEEYIKTQSMKFNMGRKLLAVVTEGESGRNYHEPTDEQEKIIIQEKPSWLPTQNMDDSTTALVSGRGYGFKTWDQLFTTRQLTALNTFSSLLQKVKKEIQSDVVSSNSNKNYEILNNSEKSIEYSEAIIVYLAFMIDKSADHWSSFTSWRISAEAHRTTFSRQALPMVWDYTEVNPFSNSAGNWMDASVQFISKSISYLPALKKGKVFQADARNLVVNDNIHIISTDPPYYDNINYADLSDYFYVWMRHNLQSLYPDIFSTLLVPKENELIADSSRFHGESLKAEEYFEGGLLQSFKSIRKFNLQEYPVTIYYAFKQEELLAKDSVSSTGWETILNALIKSGYMVVGTWPVRTEKQGRMISIGTNALASSIVLVCRIRDDNSEICTRRDFINSLRNELPSSINEMQSGNIAPVDLAQAAIGPGMAVYSRYEKVLEPDGSSLTIRTALQIINQVLDEYLAEQEGNMDQASRFAVAWFEQNAFEEGLFGQADVLARAKNTSVEGMDHSGILTAEAGKVRLLRWDELDPGQVLKSGMVWAATHLLIERLNTYGEEGVATLLANLPSELAADARQLAYRLYSISDRKGWSALARNYNALVVSWNESQEEAQKIRKNTVRQDRLFEEE